MNLEQNQATGIPLRGPRAHAASVIVLTFIHGTGTETDRKRAVTRFFSADGELLAEADPVVPDQLREFRRLCELAGHLTPEPPAVDEVARTIHAELNRRAERIVELENQLHDPLGPLSQREDAYRELHDLPASTPDENAQLETPEQ